MSPIYRGQPMYTVCPIEDEESDFSFGLDDGDRQVGKVEFVIEPSVPNYAWLCELPPTEMSFESRSSC